MIELSKEEFIYLKEQGKDICSMCRYYDPKNPRDCLKRHPSHIMRAGKRCIDYASNKGRTPEQQRIAAMRAAEAQLSLFEGAAR